MTCEESFRHALRQSGIEYSGPILVDGKLHRVKANGDHSKNSWYVLYSGPPVIGAYGCWKRDFKEAWCERNGSLTGEERQSVRQWWQEANAKLKAETAALQKKARKTAEWILNRSRPARTLHRYLDRKRVKVLGNLRQYRRALVVPLLDSAGELQSLQFIDGDGTKKFLSGGRVAGCFFTLTDKTDVPLVICEGYATGASIHEATTHAVICAMNSGNLLEVAKSARAQWPQREIIIAADSDQFTDGNPGLTKATAAAKAIRAKLAVPQFKDIRNKPTDFNDLATGESLDAVREQIGAAREEHLPKAALTEKGADGAEAGAPRKESDAGEDAIIASLAALPQLEYERVRKDEAKKLGCRPSILDSLVSGIRLLNRVRSESDNLQGVAVNLEDVEQWPEPVNGAEILDAIAKRFEHYVVLPDGAADVAALWSAHTHVFGAFQISPRLNVSAPTQECGKTTLRDCVALFCARSMPTENMTTAVMFRLVAGHRPTILADECDKWLFTNEELVGLVQSGHRKGGHVMRCEGDLNELRKFRCYAPVLLAAIGALPSQLHSRSIVIRLERATREEIKACALLNSERVEHENELSRKLARWIADNREHIESCKPELPENLFNRIADNWRPLFAIAGVAGGDWPRRCASALVKLTMREDESESLRVMLLADIQKNFTANRMFSKDLVDALADLKERPWPEICRGQKPITERWLARNLAAFGIHSKSIRIGEDNAKGYERKDFEDVFSRYVGDGGNLSVTPSQTIEKPESTSVTTRGETARKQASHEKEKPESTSVTTREVVTHTENDLLLGKKGICDAVTDKKGDTPPKCESEAEKGIIDEHGVARV